MVSGIVTIVDVSDLVGEIDEFFVVAQPAPGELCDAEEREVAASLGIHDVLGMDHCYNSRDDAQAVASELNSRKATRQFFVLSSKVTG